MTVVNETHMSDEGTGIDESFARMAECSPVLIWLSHEDGSRYFFNREWLKFTGRTGEEERGTGWLSGVHPDDVVKLQLTLEALREAPAEFAVEYRLKRHDGQYRWMMERGVPHESRRNKSGFIGSCADIHDQRTAETGQAAVAAGFHPSLTDDITELIRSNSALEQFAFTASHDLKEPLRKIQYFTDKMMQKPDSAPQMAERTREAAGRMMQLIDNLLHLATLSGGKTALEAVDLSAIFEEVQIELESIVKRKNARIDVGQVPSVRGIRRQLYLMFLNIISNALTYVAGDTAPHIRIDGALTAPRTEIPDRLRDSAEQLVQVSVTDNGIGFDEEDAERVFMPFQRLHSRHQYPGSGLGLAMCRRVAENHGGAILARSKKGAGTTILIYLRAA